MIGGLPSAFRKAGLLSDHDPRKSNDFGLFRPGSNPR